MLAHFANAAIGTQSTSFFLLLSSSSRRIECSGMQAMHTHSTESFRSDARRFAPNQREDDEECRFCSLMF